MQYEYHSLGTGTDYPIVWDWVINIKNYPIIEKNKDNIFISFTNGRWSGGDFSKDDNPYKVMEQCQATIEQAWAIHNFIQLKFKDREKNEANAIAKPRTDKETK